VSAATTGCRGCGRPFDDDDHPSWCGECCERCGSRGHETYRHERETPGCSWCHGAGWYWAAFGLHEVQCRRCDAAQAVQA
jgi:hypothetical protein